jgi:hypothetical protein
MSEFAPWMFLVKVESGRKPRVCQISPYEVIGPFTAHRSRRRPRAWRASRANAVAAIGNTVDEAYSLIEKLEGRSA